MPNEKQLIEKGDHYWKLQDWQHCLESYDEAIRLNPESEARVKRQMVMQIIEFFNKDMLNP